MAETECVCSSCEKELEFMGYCLLGGIDPRMVLVGCPKCKTMCYMVAESHEEVEAMPHMKQADWSKVHKAGKWRA